METLCPHEYEIPAQPYNDFFAIKRIVVPLTLEPTLSQQHEIVYFYLMKSRTSVEADVITFIKDPDPVLT